MDLTWLFNSDNVKLGVNQATKHKGIKNCMHIIYGTTSKQTCSCDLISLRDDSICVANKMYAKLDTNTDMGYGSLLVIMLIRILWTE